MPARTSPINAVQKACRILRSLSSPDASRLSEIANITSLNKATALRILEMLAREGFVEREEATKTWSLGAEVYLLGTAASRRHNLRERARPSMVRLARRPPTPCCCPCAAGWKRYASIVRSATIRFAPTISTSAVVVRSG